MRRVAFLVATATDDSRWRRASRRKPCASGVRLKYLHEHFLATRACGRDPCPLRPPHPDLQQLFAEASAAVGNGSRRSGVGGTGGRRRSVAHVLGSLELDRGYIDGVAWGPAWDLLKRDQL